MKLHFCKYKLLFTFNAGTSRGVMTDKVSWMIRLSVNGKFGFGECGPLPGLSLESEQDVEGELRRLQAELPRAAIDQLHEIGELTEIASIRFGLETAYLDLMSKAPGLIFKNDFSQGRKSIPINGLVWMGEREFMKAQIDEKIEAGFDCLKLKIGAIDFEQELSLLAYIRNSYSERDLTLRVDANGAFGIDSALDKLHRLSAYDIHSIEQPIAPGQEDAMFKLCQESPIPIALDEEIIGIKSGEEKATLLDKLRPQYIILKPTLVGGIAATREWISVSEERKIGWWITSALESNIGLNAIAQLTAEYDVRIPQGLGTGKLYHNNIPSPLTISEGMLEYGSANRWDYSYLDAVI